MKIGYNGASLLLGTYECPFIEANANACLFSKKVHDKVKGARVAIKINYINDQKWQIVISVDNVNFHVENEEIGPVSAAILMVGVEDSCCDAKLVVFDHGNVLKIDRPARVIIDDNIIIIKEIEELYQDWR